VPFHEPVSVCPAGSVKVTVHPLIVEVPVLVMVSGWMTYPVAHWVCTVGTAVQVAVDVPGWVVTCAVFETGEVLPAVSRALT
jgi:hypothetical protein